MGKRLLVRPREQREPGYQGRNAGDRFEELAPIHEVHPPLMNIEAQNSFGRFRSPQYDLGPRGTQKTRTGARVRVELVNQYG